MDINVNQNNEKTEDRIIDGFYFKSKSEYHRALKEKETIEQLKRSIDVENINSVEQMYMKMVAKPYFATPVGLGFLSEMRSYIVENTGNEDMPLVPVPLPKRPKQKGDSEAVALLKDEIANINIKKKRITIVMITLIVVVVGMFFIMATNDNRAFFKTEEKILDNYSSWQETLDQKEKELNEREEQLDKREEELNKQKKENN